jgi:hypothetical protein
MTTTKPAPRYRANILDEEPQAIDAQAVFAQAGQWTLIRVGAVNHLYSATHAQLDVRSGGAKRRIVITLAGDDTYSLEIGKVQRKTFAWLSLNIERGIHAADLGAAIERAYTAGFRA